MAHDRVEAVERALSILESFSETRPSLSLADLSAETGLYKSTILRLCASLQRFGYLTRNQQDGCFRPGPSVWRLAALYRRSYDLGEYIRPTLRKLVVATGETASFSVRDGQDRVCLYRENSPNPIRHHLDEGVRLPLDRGAAGRVLRAFSGDGDADHDVARKGFAVSVGERSPDVAAVAVPVFRAFDKYFRGALAVSEAV